MTGEEDSGGEAGPGGAEDGCVVGAAEDGVGPSGGATGEDEVGVWVGADDVGVVAAVVVPPPLRTRTAEVAPCW